MQTITTTDAALVLAYGLALDRYPTEKARILKGAKIAAQPFDVLEHDGYATVNSSDGARRYTVNGSCECADFQRGTERCKHRFAVSLHRKMANLHKAMLSPENQWCATVDGQGGVVHIVEEVWFHVPYDSPRGQFTNSAACILGAAGTTWPKSKAEADERLNAAHYEEFGEVA